MHLKQLKAGQLMPIVSLQFLGPIPLQQNFPPLPPLMLERSNFSGVVLRQLGIEAGAPDLSEWERLSEAIKNVDREAESILSAARKKAIDNEAAIVAKAKEEAHSIVERANSEAEQEKLRVKDDVKKEMINVASAVARKAVGSSMDVSVQESLVDETLKEIGEGTWLS